MNSRAVASAVVQSSVNPSDPNAEMSASAFVVLAWVENPMALSVYVLESVSESAALSAL
jgi:hypothetical protein